MGTPIPHISNEQKGTGSGPVHRYHLTPEEVAALLQPKPIPKTHHKPISFLSRQPREENNNMKEPKLTKEQYLAMRISGLSRKDVAKQLAYTVNHLENYWLLKWKIKDPDQEEMAIIEFSGKTSPNESPGNQQTFQNANSEDHTEQGQVELMSEVPGENAEITQLEKEKLSKWLLGEIVNARGWERDNAEKQLYDIAHHHRLTAANLQYVFDCVESGDFNSPQPPSGSFEKAKSIQSVIAERQRQDAKWGQQNHEPVYWLGILGEEFGELCQAINETVFNNGPEERLKGGYINMRTEAVQAAAVAIAFVETLDRQYAGQEYHVTK